MQPMKRHLAKGVILMVLILSSSLVSYRLGVKKGALNASVERIPFDLCIYLEMYEMSSYIFSSEKGQPKRAWGTNNVKVLLSGTLDLYDSLNSRDKKRISGNSYFQQDIENARVIVEDAVFVNLHDAVEKEFGKSGEQKIRVLGRDPE